MKGNNRKTLRRSFGLLFSFQVVLVVLAMLFLIFLYINQINLAKSRVIHFDSYLLADELRQSSDDLTKFVRAYVATGDPQFEKYYYAVAGIRDGIVPRPERYDHIYWDFYVAEGGKPRSDEALVSLDTLMARQSFTEEELGKLKEAQKKSDELIKAEMMAFNAVKGLYLDERGDFTLQGEPNIAWANELVNGPEYYKTKAEIMRPLDEFFNLFETRLGENIAYHLKISNTFFIADIVLGTVLLLLFAFSFIKIRKQIVEKENSEAEVIKLNSQLEKRVAERIRMFEDKNQQLGASQKAILNVLDDIETEKERAQKAVNDLDKFKLAVENASDHIVITDPDGLVLYVNKAAERITGFSAAEILGKKAGGGELWGGHMDKDFYVQMWDTIKNKKQVFVGKLTNERKSGEQYMAQASITPALDQGGTIKFFVGIERDITKEHEVDMAKTEFVSLASHQLRTPLSAINWYTEMLLDGDAGKLNKEQKEYLTEIYTGNQRMVGLVNSLLNVSRLEVDSFMIEPVLMNIIDVSEDVIKEMQPQVLEKKLNIKKDYDEKVEPLFIDPNLTRIIFQNLISNAVKYTPREGTVEVSISKNDKDVIIKVKDTGLGIPLSQKDKIFTKLFRADNARKTAIEGTGLGLYLVKSILDHVGGTVSFISEENKGTTFEVTMPLTGMKRKEGTKKLDQ